MITRNMKTLGAAFAATALLFGAALFRAVDHPPSYRFQEAIDLMETKGDYPAAIRVFEELAKGADRNLAARSLLYMGLCYEKLGKDEARKAYERVLREYADQSEAATEARTRLAALSGHGATKTSELVTRRVWAGPDVDTEGGPSPDGRYLSFVDYDTGDVALRDLATGEKRHLTNKGSWSQSSELGGSPRISPDSRQVAYAWYNKNELWDLRIVRLDGSNPRVLYSNGEVTPYPDSWSPDGKYIAAHFYRKDGSTQIALVSVADGSVRVLKTFDWRPPGGMRFSPDGRYIVYVFPPKEDSLNDEIFLIATDGSREVPLIEHPANDFSPLWAPDGGSILFISDRTGSAGLWAIEIEDGKPRGSPRLVKSDIGRSNLMGFSRSGSLYYGLEIGAADVYTASLDPASGKVLAPPTRAVQNFVGRNTLPDWSPDGRYLAYLSLRAVGFNGAVLCVLDIGTGAQRELYPKLSFLYWPRWSPDSRSIGVWGRDAKGRYGFYQIDVETSKVTPLLQNEPEVYPIVSWSPDGKAIFFKRGLQEPKGQAIVMRDVKTGQERELHRMISKTNWIGQLDPSPDGRQLAFTTHDQGTRSVALEVIPASGGEPRELIKVRHPEVIHPIAWTPDGRQVLFGKELDVPRERKTELWRVPAQGGEPEKLGLTMDHIGEIRVHPDGKRIALAAGQIFSAEVWVMENFLSALKASR